MQLITLKKRRGRGDCIIKHALEETDCKYLTMKRKGENKKKLQEGIYLNNIKKYSFSQKSVDTWNGMKEEMIMAKLKEKLDEN